MYHYRSTLVSNLEVGDLVIYAEGLSPQRVSRIEELGVDHVLVYFDAIQMDAQMRKDGTVQALVPVISKTELRAVLAATVSEDMRADEFIDPDTLDDLAAEVFKYIAAQYGQEV